MFGKSMSFQNQVAIVGIGETEYSRSSGRSELELSLEAIQAALQDDCNERSEVDGLMRSSVST